MAPTCQGATSRQVAAPEYTSKNISPPGSMLAGDPGDRRGKRSPPMSSPCPSGRVAMDSSNQSIARPLATSGPDRARDTRHQPGVSRVERPPRRKDQALAYATAQPRVGYVRLQAQVEARPVYRTVEQGEVLPDRAARVPGNLHVPVQPGVRRGEAPVGIGTVAGQPHRLVQGRLAQGRLVQGRLVHAGAP